MVFAACADLVGLYTFNGADPLASTIGAPALEGVVSANGTAPALTNILQTISPVTDADVLGTRHGVVSVPSKSTLAIPNPGLRKDWTIVLPFYCPVEASWRCFFQFTQRNNSDGSLFIKNNAQIGASSYDNTSGIVGKWHQLTVSCTNGTATVWYDAQKLGNTRSWTLPGNGLIYFSLDNDGEDATMYLDDIRLYDETVPAEVFPDGPDAGPAILDPFEEKPYADDFASFTRTPDEVIEDPPYRTYIFRRHGTFSFSTVKKCDGCSALFVGGGGAGGLIRGGGGGGGAVVYEDNITLLAQTYVATIGAGGIPDIHKKWWASGQDLGQLHPGVSTAATCGGATTLSASSTVLYTAPGGGGGGNFNYSGNNLPSEGCGLDGASGGGAAGKCTQPGHGIAGLGHDGGEAATDGDNSGGGGGGAGGPGTKGSNSVAGAGGAGVTNSITGSPVVYGGGGGASSYNIDGGLPGEGGGGKGVSSKGDLLRDTACNGVDGLGGGGGGGSGRGNSPNSTMGGRGGDGAMILRVYLVGDDDPVPTIAVSSSDIGYTNATLDVRLLSFGSGGSSANVTLRVSANEDLSSPFVVTNLPGPITEVPSLVSVACAQLLTNATYYAQATAVNNVPVEGTSAVFAFTTLDPEPPTVAATPAGVGFGTVSATATLSSFGAGSVDATVYLDCSASGAFDDTVSSPDFYIDVLPCAQDLTTAGLEVGLNYSYRVRAVNTWGLEGFSQTFTATTDPAPVRLSEISAIPAGDGLETIAVSALDVAPGVTYSLEISVDGSTVRTWADQTESDTFSVDYPATGSHTAIVQISCSYGGSVYVDSRSASFSAGSSRIVVTDYADHCSAVTAIRVYPGDTVILPPLPWGWSYRVLNSRFLSLDGFTVTALEPAVAGIEVCSGSSVVGTMAVLVLPDAIKGGGVYIYNEKSATKDYWTRVESWEKVGSAQNDSYPCSPNDIAVIPFYDTTSLYLRHEADLSLGGVIFGNFCDVEAIVYLERHSSVTTKTITFERTDDAPAFVKVTPNTTTARTHTLRFGGYDILVNCISSVIADSCSDTTNADLNRGKITYEKCTVHIPEGRYWAVDGIPGYDLNMGGTIGPPKLTGAGMFWKKGMGGITFDNSSLAFEGTLLDTSHGHIAGFNRAGPIYWKKGNGTNICVAVAGRVHPQLGSPSESSKGYGYFRTGWEHGYGEPSEVHPDEPWNPRKTMTMRGGVYRAYYSANGNWGVGVRDTRLFEKLVVGPGMSYVQENAGNNSGGNPINCIEWDAIEHKGKGTLVITDPSRRSAAPSSTNTMTIVKNHDAFLVGAGKDGDCLSSDIYPIIPWIVASTTTEDSNWRDTLFASFDAEEGRLVRPHWNNTALDAAASQFSNAYLWDKTIEIGNDVTLNSLFMNNGGKNKYLGEGKTLTITSGGLVLHGENTAIGLPGRTDNGALVLGNADHPGYVFAKSSNASKPNQIWASVAASGGFVSSYSGALVLGGDQTGISGEIVVNAGVLTLGTAEYSCMLSGDLQIRICAGATLGLPRVDAIGRNMVWFDGAAGQFGKIEVPEGVAAKCKKAYWRNYPETDEWQSILRGIYTGDPTTALAVGAIYDPDHFSGAGTIEVLRDDSVIPLVIRLR